MRAVPGPVPGSGEIWWNTTGHYAVAVRAERPPLTPYFTVVTADGCVQSAKEEEMWPATEAEAAQYCTRRLNDIGARKRDRETLHDMKNWGKE